jgi:hypothetical protein
LYAVAYRKRPQSVFLKEEYEEVKKDWRGITPAKCLRRSPKKALLFFLVLMAVPNGAGQP